MTADSMNAQASVSREAFNLPALLVIMDGFGLAEAGEGNAISQAKTPCLDRLLAECSHTTLQASGEAVGLPDGQMGNSEVGHLNIGAGRIVYQELTRINRACADGSLAHNAVLNEAFEAARMPGAALHFMGLVSDGGVHSSNEHLYALVRAAVAAGVSDIRVHCFMDGRDVPPKSGKGYIEELQSFWPSSTGRAQTCRLQALKAAITRWTATTDGSASSAPTGLSCAPSRCSKAARQTPCSVPTMPT